MGRIMKLCMALDGVLSSQNAMPHRAPDAQKKYERAASDTAKRIRQRIKNLVRDAHRKVAHDLIARFDTIVLPVFETSRMVRRGTGAPGDPRRKINSKAARALLTLSHYKFRTYLAHASHVRGAELCIVGEEYTTKACPYCGECKNVGSSKTFRCTGCHFVADRDEKAAFTIAVKHIDPDAVKRRSGGPSVPTISADALKTRDGLPETELQCRRAHCSDAAGTGKKFGPQKGTSNLLTTGP